LRHVSFWISTFENEGEKDILRRLERMNIGDEMDDDNGLLTVSSQCRPILEHKLVRNNRNFVQIIKYKLDLFRLEEH